MSCTNGSAAGFPRVKNFERTRADLANFYATRTDYHKMTACEDKPDIRRFACFWAS